MRVPKDANSRRTKNDADHYPRLVERVNRGMVWRRLIQIESQILEMRDLKTDEALKNRSTAKKDQA